MVEFSEARRIQQKINRPWPKLEDVDIDDSDREAIREFVVYRRDADGWVRTSHS